MSQLRHFLKQSEIDQLKVGLMQCEPFTTHTPSDRANFLLAAGLDSFIDTDTSGGTQQYFVRLFPLLSDRFIPYDEGSRLALIVLLSSLNDVYYQNVAEEIRRRFDTIINAYTEWESGGRPRRPEPEGTDRQAALFAQLQQPARKEADDGHRETSYKLDEKAVLLMYDLDEQLKALSGHLDARGLFSFELTDTSSSIIGMLNEYLIERVQEHLRTYYSGRSVRKHEVGLHTEAFGNGVAASDLIETQFQKNYKCRFEELFTGQNDIVLLVIWNHALPQQPLQRVATSFERAMKRRLLPSLRQKDSLLVIMWVSLTGCPLNSFKVIPTLSNFDQVELVSWFAVQLARANVVATDVDYAMRQLKSNLSVHRGDRSPTYTELKSIIYNLRTGQRP